MASTKSSDDKTSIAPQNQADEKGAVAQNQAARDPSLPKEPITPAPPLGAPAPTASAQVSASYEAPKTTQELADAPVYRVKFGTLNLGYALDKDGKSTGEARTLNAGDIVTGLEAGEYDRLIGLGIVEKLK